MKRKAETILLSLLYLIATTVLGAFIEKEYGITVEIKKIIQVEEVNATK